MKYSAVVSAMICASVADKTGISTPALPRARLIAERT